MINLKINKQTAIFSAIALVLGVLSASIYWYLNPRVKQVEVSNSNQPTKTECNKKICIDSLDELWVEYKDEKYGFSFMYPQKIMNLESSEYVPTDVSQGDWKYINKIIGLEGDMIKAEKKYSSWVNIEIFTKTKLNNLSMEDYAIKNYKDRKALSDRGDAGYGVSYSFGGLNNSQIDGLNVYSYDWGLSENTFFYKPFEIEKIRTIFIDLDGYIMKIEAGRDIVANQIVDSLKFTTPNNATN